MNMFIGNHLSSSKGFESMGKEALKLNANTFAFFTRNPRGGSAKAIDLDDALKLRKLMEEHGFGTLVAHAPYTMNVCAAKEDIRKFSRDMLKEDMERMEYLPGNFYNFHPGSHVGQGAEAAIPMIADAINNALKPEHNTIILLETMAGKGSEVGRSFEELRAIMDLVELKDKVGVCFDTCHVWDGGYDIVSNLDGVLKEFDDIIGIDNLRAVHFNDSMNLCGSHKDRHQKIGEGEIGTEALKAVTKHPLLADKPFILETPNDDAGYAREIEMIRNW
jgi:deoxyribonuclease-4